MATSPPDRALLTDEQIAAWRALVAAHARISVLLEAELEREHGLPLVEYEVLVHLLDAPDRRLRMTELADRVLLSRSGLTRLVDRMERDRLVLRAVCAEDGRGTYAVLTEAGMARLREASGVYFRGLREHLVDALPHQDVAELGRILSTLVPIESDLSEQSAAG